MEIPPLVEKNMKHILKISKTLYHGTSTDYEESIKEFGLIPGGLDENIGDFTREYYDFSEEEEASIIPAVFLANKEEIGKAFSAMKSHVARKLGKYMGDVTEEDIKNFGLLAVVKDLDDSIDRVPKEQAKKDHWQMSMEEGGESVANFEPGDFYSLSEIRQDYIIKGKALIRFLRRAGLIKSNQEVSHSGLRKNRDWQRQRLIYLARKMHPEVDQETVVEKIKGLTDQELNSYLESQGGYEDLYREKMQSTLASLAKALGHLKIGAAMEVEELAQKLAAYNTPRAGKKRWSVKYKRDINCSSPKGFSQEQYCRRKAKGGKYK